MIRAFVFRFAALTALTFVIFATVGMKSVSNASSTPVAASAAPVTTAAAR
ncbi:MAG TPA: hypothetical protein VJM11_17995 [Nevskiaceae bacterium]|nr:hypothetical protein [Nevskiaceae bacterium]